MEYTDHPEIGIKWRVNCGQGLQQMVVASEEKERVKEMYPIIVLKLVKGGPQILLKSTKERTGQRVACAGNSREGENDGQSRVPVAMAQEPP